MRDWIVTKDFDERDIKYFWGELHNPDSSFYKFKQDNGITVKGTEKMFILSKEENE